MLLELYGPTPAEASHRIYLSKARAYYQCEAKAWFQYHLRIADPKRPYPMDYGIASHLLTHVALQKQDQNWAYALTLKHDDLVAVLRQEGFEVDAMAIIEEGDLTQMNDLLDAFWIQWHSEPREILALEQSFVLPLLSPHFQEWVVKPDQLYRKANGKIWNGDWKTTARYGASVAVLYHNAPQTKQYAQVVKFLLTQLGYDPNDFEGTEIFVGTKTKQPRCEVEAIPFTQKDELLAKRVMADTLQHMEQVEARFAKGYCNRNPYHCFNEYNQKCPFWSICQDPGVTSKDYIAETIQSWFRSYEPEEHLELDGPV